MATKAELQERIKELEVSLAKASAIEQISRGLNTARDEDEMLQVLTRPAREARVTMATLIYIDLNEVGEPEWAEVVAAWQQEDAPAIPVGTRYYLPEFPFARLWMASQDEPQLIANVATDERVDEKTGQALAQGGTHALALIPLAQAGRWVGLTTLSWDEPHEFSEQEVKIYQGLIGLASPAVENRRLLIQKERAAAEQRSAALLRSVIDATPDWIFAKDQRFRYTLVSKGYADALHLTPDDLLGKDDVELGFPEELVFGNPEKGIRGFRTDDTAVLKNGETVVNPYDPATSADGEVHIFHTIKTPLYDAEGNIWAALGFARDITERERLVAEIKTLYEISRSLSTAHNEDALLHILARPSREAGAFNASLMYVELDEAGEPEWAEVVAIWQREGTPASLVGTRYYIPEFPFTRPLMASQKEPQLIADATTDERLDKNSRDVIVQTGIRAMAIIPLAQAGRWVGFLSFGWNEPHQFSEQEIAIYNALTGLASPAVESRRLVDNLEQMVAERTAELQKSEERYRTLIENHPYGIHENDASGIVTYANPAYHQIFGYAKGETAVGVTIWDTLESEEEREGLRQYLAFLVKEQPPPEIYYSKSMTRDGKPIDIKVDWNYKRDEQGDVIGFISITTDITEQKRAEQERERLQQQIIEAQKVAIQELSTPIIPIMDRIIVMPLVGSIDTTRARDIMRALLAGISEYRAKMVIVDITGVPIVDTGVASHLDKAIQAARLKGAQTIVTGISDAVAEAIVDLGIDWSGFETLSDLQTGLITALNSLGIKLSR